MSMLYKAFLYEIRPNKPKEIRRFSVDHDVSSSYDYLRQKVASIFPDLSEANFTLQYKDSEGDFICFNSDEELLLALSDHEDGLFKIFVKDNNQSGRAADTGDEASESFNPRQRWKCPPRWNRCGSGPRKGNFSSPQFPFPWMMNMSAGCNFPAGAGCQSKQDEGKSQFQNQSSQSAHQWDNKSPPPVFTNEGYLQNVGNAVADFLRPFGVDVDVNIEHRGKTSKCPGSDQSKCSGDGDAQPSKDAADTSSQTAAAGDEHEWTFVKPDHKQASSSTPGGENCMETDDSAAAKDNEALTQLLAMGFNNDNGWLERLLQSCNGDISKALDTLQQAHQR